MTVYEQGRAFGGVIDVLEAVGATYAIWGGLAVIAYGEARFTHDLDILLNGVTVPVSAFLRRLTETHYHVDAVAVNNALGGGYFNVIHQHYHIKTDFYIPSEPDLLMALRERVYLPFDEIRRAAYITVDRLIVAKLRAYADSGSTRHLEDIGSIVRIQGDKLDAAALDAAAARLGVLGQWRAQWGNNQP